MKKVIFLLFAGIYSFGQPLAPLTVEKIMRRPTWMGVAPSNVFWSEDGKQLFFNWNPDKGPACRLDRHFDPGSPGVEGVLDKFLDYRGGPFHDFARRDLVRHFLGQNMDVRHQVILQTGNQNLP